MKNNTLKVALAAFSLSAIVAGCTSINANQDVSSTIPKSFEYTSYKMDGTDQENKMVITIETAETKKADEGAEHPLELQFSGRFYHHNPRIKTDSPFVAKAGIRLLHHGDGIVTIENPELLSFKLLSVHTPVRSLVSREAKDAFSKTINGIEGQRIPEQKLLKINSYLKDLFKGQ